MLRHAGFASFRWRRSASSMSETELLTTYLLMQRALKEDSEFYRWITVLPKKFDVPVLWSDDVIRRIEMPQTESRLHNMRCGPRFRRQGPVLHCRERSQLPAAVRADRVAAHSPHGHCAWVPMPSGGGGPFCGTFMEHPLPPPPQHCTPDVPHRTPPAFMEHPLPPPPQHCTLDVPHRTPPAFMDHPLPPSPETLHTGSTTRYPPQPLSSTPPPPPCALSHSTAHRVYHTVPHQSCSKHPTMRYHILTSFTSSVTKSHQTPFSRPQ